VLAGTAIASSVMVITKSTLSNVDSSYSTSKSIGNDNVKCDVLVTIIDVKLENNCLG